MTTPLHRPTRHAHAAVVVFALLAIAFGVSAAAPDAASGPLTFTPITWDVLGLDSNNVNTGPNVFPVGVRVCNTGSDPATNVVATWAWKTAQNSFTGPTDGATVSVGTMAAGFCRHAYFEVTLNRSVSSRKKSRDYQVTLTADGGLSTAGAQRTLYIQPLVSQNRNSTKKLAGPGGCNLAYTVCDPAPANIVVGRTYTYKFYAETSTAYQQLETFANFPTSILQVISTSATYSNPTGAASTSIYADACGWNAATRACVGPANISGGKAGGRIVVTYVVKAVAPGSGTLRAAIYDFSGASFHYNADFNDGALTLTATPLTVRYELATAIAGNGKVISSPAGTLTGGSSSGINCGGTGTACSVGYGTGTSVTLTAQPLGSETFTGWSGGGCSGTALTCTVTMSQSRSVTATFTGVTSYLLDVSKVGSGTVNADVAPVSCGATCSGNYASGTPVTLTATPSTGWTFDGWSGEGCTGTGTCAVTMSQARSVTATFIEQTFPLSVSVTGNGVVTANVGAISCGNGDIFCDDVYGAGTLVTLTATPASGQSLTSWSGACSGSAATCIVTMDQARVVTAAFSGTASYPLEVGTGGSGTGSVTSNVGGINCGATCSATYTDGALVTLTATASGTSNFNGWSGDCSGTSTTCVVTMSQARSVNASFGPPNWLLTVSKSGAGTGTVTSDFVGINCGATCSASFADGTLVTLTAVPSSGSSFTGWSGDCSGTSTCTVTMSAARNVTATFGAAYTLAVTKTGSGTGTVTSDVGGISCGASCSADYGSATVVTLTAVASVGSRFTGWSGEGCSDTGTCTVTMSQARNVSARFVTRYTLTVSKTGSGSVTGPGIDCGAYCNADYDDGTVFALTATASAGSRFTGWSGACTGSGSCTVTMSQARTVTANFVAVYTLTVSKTGSGGGTVTGTGINCGATCSSDYDDGTAVTLTATAAAGSRFTGWSGEGCSDIGTCIVTMSQARNVTARFVTRYTLTVSKTGSGSVTGPGIDCGAYCNADYDDGTVFALTATASAGSRFAGWSGACTGTTSCTVTMSQARNVTASFIAVYTLTVTKNGSGGGTITGTGINCGATCSSDYDDDTAVTLTATASSGSRFTGWTGACTGTASCTVTMSQTRSVGAGFVAVYTLTTATAGSGTVSSDVGAITCGAFCSADYDDGTVVTLTATAAAGSRFTGWSGACAGTASCTVTMSQARSVTAGFIVLYTLTVSTTGSGTATSGTAGINCGAFCSSDYDDGTVVTLTATAAAGSRFTGWSGACTGTASCTVTMSQARSVTAGFIAVYTLTVTKTGSGGGTVASTGINCGATCTSDYDDGTVVTVTATASSGSHFAGWSGACTGTSSCTVTLTQARTVTANFIAVYGLSVTRTGLGTVTAPTINCGATCDADFDDGTVVTLTATAAAGSRFTGWSGACTGIASCTVTMSQARKVAAGFIAVYTLAVIRTGSGEGTVTGTGSNCGATCSNDYDDGTAVTLTATASSGSRFTGWSGACTGTSNCTATMSQARTVIANFIAVYTLTTTMTGSGSGIVTGSAGINCGAFCSGDYADGTAVTLTATASSGSRFTGWSGACTGTGTSTCTVTMSQARNVTANFIAVYALTVTKTGSGDGSVTATTINCGVTCNANFDDGTVVTLGSTVSTGSRFAGWTGACTGAASCTVTMSQARNVTATFIRIVPLTVTVTGPGAVSSEPNGIDCGHTCATEYDAGTHVTLEATAKSGYWFLGWSGACTGSETTCTVTASQARLVHARFARELQLRLFVPDELVYHQPYERATVRAFATWRGKPLAGAQVDLLITCPGRRSTAVLRTGDDGRASFIFGATMPNSLRVDACAVHGRIAANNQTARTEKPGIVRFIHPLWLETKVTNSKIVVRVWGRAGEAVELFADGNVVGRTRIGRHGWVDMASPKIQHGIGLWVTGAHGHRSHRIGA